MWWNVRSKYRDLASFKIFLKISLLPGSYQNNWIFTVKKLPIFKEKLWYSKTRSYKSLSIWKDRKIKDRQIKENWTFLKIVKIHLPVLFLNYYFWDDLEIRLSWSFSDDYSVLTILNLQNEYVKFRLIKFWGCDKNSFSSFTISVIIWGVTK